MFEKDGYMNRQGLEQANIPGLSSNSQGEFLRVEDKYVIPNRFLDIVIPLLDMNMKPSFPDKNTKYSMIESLYFDSHHLDFFLHDMSQRATRYKLRIRRYAPDGIWADEHHLELKRKRGEESKKVRFQVGPSEMESLMKGEAIVYNQELEKLNPNIDAKTLKSRVEKIDQLILKYQLFPVRSVTYKRLAYELGDCRVTVDTQLTQAEYSSINEDYCHRLKLKKFWQNADKLIKKFSFEDYFVLEVKHTGKIPFVIEQALEGLESMKSGNLSKYTYFTALALDSHD